MKWIKRISWLLVFGLVIGWSILHFIAPGILLEPTRQHVGNIEQEAARSHMTWKSEEGLNLHATYFKIENSNGVFLVIHGIGACRKHSVRTCEFLNECGYDAVAVDLRAHGESEGDYCTYGIFEREDLSRWLDEFQTDQPVFLWGTSLGGAVALQTLAHDSRLSGGVIISTFGRLSETALDYQDRMFGLRWEWLREYNFMRGEQIAGFNPWEANPLESCAAIDQPVFMVHGNQDVHIDVEYAYRNFEALATPEKVLHIVEGADHNSAWAVGGQSLRDELVDFLHKNFR